MLIYTYYYKLIIGYDFKIFILYTYSDKFLPSYDLVSVLDSLWVKNVEFYDK